MTSPARSRRGRGRLVLLVAAVLALAVPIVVGHLVSDEGDGARAGANGKDRRSIATQPARAVVGEAASAAGAATGKPARAIHRGPRCWGRTTFRWCRPTTQAATATTAPAPGAPGAAAGGSSQRAATSRAIPGGFPNPASTGVPAGWSPKQTHQGDLTITQPGAVIQDILVTGAIEVQARNVTIRRVRVYGPIDNYYAGTTYGGLLIEDTEIGPDTGINTGDTEGSGIGIGGYTARRVEIHNVIDGFRVGGSDIVIEDSFVDVGTWPGECPHYDGVQGFGGGTNVVIRHNTLDDRGDCGTSAVFMADTSRAADVQDNLLLGGAYSLSLYQLEAPSTFVAVNNRIVEGSYDYGPLLLRDGGALTATCGGNRLVTIDDNYQVTGDRDEVPCTTQKI
jgi:hypothetical protein